MKKIRIYVVGKIKDDYLKTGISSYLTKLRPYANVEIIEVKDEPIKNEDDLNEIKSVIKLEGEKIDKLRNPNDFTYLLNPNGNALSSKEFAKHLDDMFVRFGSPICFVIGGSYGLNVNVTPNSYNLSLSKLTFTHQMTRLILLEQIYRAFKIINNETYDK